MTSPWLVKFCLDNINKEIAVLRGEEEEQRQKKQGDGSGSNHDNNDDDQNSNHAAPVPAQARLVQIIERGGDWWGRLEKAPPSFTSPALATAWLLVTDGRHTARLYLTAACRATIWREVRHKVPQYRFGDFSRGRCGQLAGGSYHLLGEDLLTAEMAASLQVDAFQPRPGFTLTMATNTGTGTTGHRRNAGWGSGAAPLTEPVKDALEVRYALRTLQQLKQRAAQRPPRGNSDDNDNDEQTGTSTTTTATRRRRRRRGNHPLGDIQKIQQEEPAKAVQLADRLEQMLQERLQNQQRCQADREQQQQQQQQGNDDEDDDDESSSENGTPSSERSRSRKTIDDMLVSQTPTGQTQTRSRQTPGHEGDDGNEEEEEGEAMGRLETQLMLADNNKNEDGEDSQSQRLQTQPAHENEEDIVFSGGGQQDDEDGDDSENEEKEQLQTQPQPDHDHPDDDGNTAKKGSTTTNYDSSDSQAYFSAKETGGGGNLSDLETSDHEGDHATDQTAQALSWRHQRYQLQLSPLREDDGSAATDGGGGTPTAGLGKSPVLEQPQQRHLMTQPESDEELGGVNQEGDPQEGVVGGKEKSLEQHLTQQEEEIHGTPNSHAMQRKRRRREDAPRTPGTTISRLSSRSSASKSRSMKKGRQRHASLAADDDAPPHQTVWASVLQQFQFFASVPSSERPPIVFDKHWTADNVTASTNGENHTTPRQTVRRTPGVGSPSLTPHPTSSAYAHQYGLSRWLTKNTVKTGTSNSGGRN